MWFVGNCFLSNFLKMIFLTAVLLFQLHHGLCSPLLMRPTFVAYWRCLATATTRYPVWCRFFSLQKVKYLFPDYGIQNLTRRKWGRRAYLVNARTAELHLQQTGSSLEYKWVVDDNDSDAGRRRKAIWRSTGPCATNSCPCISRWLIFLDESGTVETRLYWVPPPDSGSGMGNLTTWKPALDV